MSCLIIEVGNDTYCLWEERGEPSTGMAQGLWGRCARTTPADSRPRLGDMDAPAGRR